MKTLIVYATKYGSTREIANWIAERIGNNTVVSDAKDMLDPIEYDLVVMGSGIYSHHVLKELNDYVERYYEQLKGKNLVIFGVAIDTTGVFVRGKVHGGWEYIIPFINKLPQPPIHAGLLGGEINPHKLDERDREDLKKFYKMLYKKETEIPFKTVMDKKAVWQFTERFMDKIGGNFIV